MTPDQRVVKKGGFPALLCFLAVLVSCSSAFSIQERLVRDFFDAARNHDVSKAVTLMPRLSLLSPDKQKAALDDLSGIGRYAITGSTHEGDAVIVTLRYRQGSDVVSLSVPVRKEGESWVIGDDFRVRRSLEGRTFEKKN